MIAETFMLSSINYINIHCIRNVYFLDEINGVFGLRQTKVARYKSSDPPHLVKV